MFDVSLIRWSFRRNSQNRRAWFEICVFVDECRTRRGTVEPRSAEEPGGAGPVEVFQLHRCRAERGTLSERDYFFDTLAEYQWARDAAGLTPETVDKLVKPVIEICEYLGACGRGTSTATSLGRVGGPDPPCAPRSTSLRGTSRSSLCGGVHCRRYASRRLPCRDYVMAKIAYLSGVRAAELCGVCMRDVHWESGQRGRFLVHGKGARGELAGRGPGSAKGSCSSRER